MSFCSEDVVEFKATVGKTFSTEFQWAEPEYVYKAITAMTNTAPISITSTAHGLVDGWRVAISAALGLTELNASADPPLEEDWYTATVVDANTVTINNVNGALLGTYTSGGYLQYLTPVDLTGYDARIEIRSEIGGTLLWSGNSEDGEMVVDDPTKAISLRIPPADTALFDAGRYEFEVEMYNGTDVHTLVSGVFLVEGEIASDA